MQKPTKGYDSVRGSRLVIAVLPTGSCPIIAPENWGWDPARTLADHMLTHHADQLESLYGAGTDYLWDHYQALCEAASEATNVDTDYIDLRCEDMLVERGIKLSVLDQRGGDDA